MNVTVAVPLYVLLYYVLYFILPTLLITWSGLKKLHNFFLCVLPGTGENHAYQSRIFQ